MDKRYLVPFVIASASLLPAMQQKQDKSKQQPGQQQQQEKKDANPPAQQQQQSQAKPDDQPKPLFQGNATLKSSKTTKDGATWGFNGIGPDGKVQQQVLSASANSADEQKAGQLALIAVSSADVEQFAKDGHLNPKNR